MKQDKNVLSEGELSPVSGEILSSDQRSHKHRQPNSVRLLDLVVSQGVALVILGVIASMSAWLFAEREVIGTPPHKCPSCKDAEAYLDEVSEPRVSPCDDFYGHVCGRWSDRAPSFEAALLTGGRSALRNRLASYPKGSHKHYTTFEKLASYYRSCYQDMESRHDMAYFVERFALTTGLRWDTLVAKHGSSELVDVLVAMSARFAVSVLIRIVTLELKYSFVVSALANDELIGASEMGVLLGKELHQKVLEAYRNREDNESRILGDAETVLPALGLGDTRSWLQAVSRHTRLNVTEDSAVALDSPKLLARALQLFALADDLARSVYLFAHVIHAVAAVHDLNVKVDGRPDVAGDECLRRLDAKQLSAAKRAFAVSTLAPERTVFRVKEMMSLVTLQLVKGVSLNSRLEAPARILLSQMLRAYSYKNVFSGPYLNMNRLDLAYQAFPASPNLYQERLWLTRFLVPEEFLDTCVGKEWSLADVDNEMCVSPWVLLPPMVYPEADKYVNYASLGFLMATRVLHAFLSPKAHADEEERALATLLATAGACQRSTRDVRDTEDVPDAIEFTLGLRSALEAYRSWAASASPMPEKPALLRTFFRRACLTLCAESPTHPPHPGSRFSSRHACNMAVRSMPEFFTAFQCRIATKMTMNGICTLF
ncbi:endothelin-converting enzyme 2-like isoform X2 [Dermacentor albipictus]|uniref:endothelin-converting enzyme 2-like isoform X2 n=1 Tax=Dermacentor albipictus TaxID=60249 RepID=UPI0031FC1616